MNIKTRYKEKSAKTQEYISNLHKAIISEHGNKFPDEYTVSLDLLADSLDMYFNALEEVRKYGLLVVGRKGELTKNPIIAVICSCQLFISKILNQFGLTAMSKSKLKGNDSTLGNDPIDEFID